MAQKGFNTLVKEAKTEIIEVVNKYLHQLPISVIGIILENLVYEIKQGCDATCLQEAEQYNKQLKEEEEEKEND